MTLPSNTPSRVLDGTPWTVDDARYWLGRMDGALLERGKNAHPMLTLTGVRFVAVYAFRGKSVAGGYDSVVELGRQISFGLHHEWWNLQVLELSQGKIPLLADNELDALAAQLTTGGGDLAFAVVRAVERGLYFPSLINPCPDFNDMPPGWEAVALAAQRGPMGARFGRPFSSAVGAMLHDCVADEIRLRYDRLPKAMKTAARHRL
jgi:hypothetical protein